MSIKSDKDLITISTLKRLKEKGFFDEINKKYGAGTLNPETGIFTKNNS